jgi:hypothetical protein
LNRIISLVVVALATIAILAPAALAQNNQDETTSGRGPFFAAPEETTMTMGSTMMETTASGTQAGNIPESGGPAILLPAAALLLGSGILTYAILRR